MFLRVTTTIVILFSLSLPGCVPPDWKPSPREEIRQHTWLTDEEIISLVRKGIVAWAEARAMFISKGYTWEEAELKLKANIPKSEWIR